MSEKPKTKYCPNCKTTWPNIDFTADKSRADGLSRICRKCKNEWQKKYRESAKAKKAAADKKKIKAVYIDPPIPSPKETNIQQIKKHAESVDPKSRYYDAGGIETIAVIKAKLTQEQYVGYLLGNIFKYAARLNSKGDTARDAEKLARYSAWLEEAITVAGP